MRKILFVSLFTVVITACTSPMSYTNQPMIPYDKDTNYSIQDTDTGFYISVEYSRYQFIPETNSVISACKQQLTSIAYEQEEKKGRKIVPINEHKIKVSAGRNGLLGLTSCSAFVNVDWAK